jgi:sugar lactone lactonase YvrE
MVDAWELWNEPDGGYLPVKPGVPKADVIRTLLDATHEALAATGRPFTLVGPAVSEINAQLGWQILDAGAGAKLDAFSFHFYSTAAAGAIPGSAQALELLARYRTHTNRFGQSLPLWHTEGGPWLSGGQSWLATSRMPASSSMTPPQAAAAIVRTALFFKANGVLRHFLYVVAASETGRDIQADGTSACVDVTGIPGPGLAAHAAMVSLTEDAAPASDGAFETTTAGDSAVSALHFTKTGAEAGNIDVYWSTKPVALATVTALRAGDVVCDMMGNTVSAIAAMTGEFPLYILRATDSAVNLPASTTVTEGGTVTFNAPALGEPLPSIRWEYHDGTAWRAIDSSAPFAHQITNGGATLTLSNVTPDLARLRFRYVATIGTLPPVPGNAAAIIVSRLYKPGLHALAVDATGVIYVANTAQNTIDAIDPAGLATVLAGDPGGAAGWLDATGTAARFKSPGGLAIRSGTVYVADTGNNVIRAIEISTGKVTTLAGNANAPSSDAAADGAGAGARLKSPAGLAIDDSGHLFVADSKSHTVRAITPDGTVTTIAGWRDEPGADAGHLDTPLGITWGGDGALYVADTGNNAIRKIIPGAQPGSGFAMTVLSAAGYASPSGVAWLDGVVHVADTGNSVIRSIPVGGAMRTLAGAVGMPGTADGPTGASTRFNAPRDIVAGPDGALYVADTGNKTVRIITDAAIGSTETPLLLTTLAPSGTITGPTSPPGDNNGGNNGGGGGAASPWFLAALATLALLAKQPRGRSGK